MHRLVGILGMITMMSLAYLFSTNRRAIRYKTSLADRSSLRAFHFNS